MESIVLIVFVIMISIMMIYLMISDILQKRRDTKLKDFLSGLKKHPKCLVLRTMGWMTLIGFQNWIVGGLSSDFGLI